MLELVDQMNRLLNTESVTPSSGDARVPPESQVTDGPPPAGTDLIQKLKNASAAGQLSRVQCLLKKWRSLPNRKTTRDPSRAMVPLQSVLYAAVRKNRSSVVCFLLDEGFVLDFQSVAIAVKGRFVEILQVFLDYGWDINEIQGPRMAPALSRALEDEQFVKWFLAHGADPNTAPLSWPPPMEMAAYSASLSVIQLLVQHGGRIRPSNVVPYTAKSPKPGRLEVLAYFLDRGAKVDDLEYEFDPSIFKKHRARQFGTALHHAADRGDEEMVNFLLERGAKQGIKDSKRKTALDVAEKAGHEKIISILRDHARIEQSEGSSDSNSS